MGEFGVTHLYFLIAENQIFSQNLGFFDEWALSSSKIIRFPT